MVMPKLPFSLFDFDRMLHFGPKYKRLAAAAGDAIPSTAIYEVPQHTIVLLMKLSVNVAKTTGTALSVHVERKNPDETINSTEVLISETADTGPYSWPSGKATGSHVLGWFINFLLPGDIIYLSHALTALETIVDNVSMFLIEYKDPRYEK